MKNVSVFVISLVVVVLNLHPVDSRAIEDFGCRVETCRAFDRGLKHYANYEQYANVCPETVNTFRAIALRHGLCFNNRQQINPECIYAVAGTIKTCMKALDGVSAMEARFLCGFTLMKIVLDMSDWNGFPSSLPKFPSEGLFSHYWTMGRITLPCTFFFPFFSEKNQQIR